MLDYYFANLYIFHHPHHLDHDMRMFCVKNISC
nr:MAG TPA: hypothetical protein [Caudoviricetes sp.]